MGISRRTISIQPTKSRAQSGASAALVDTGQSHCAYRSTSEFSSTWRNLERREVTIANGKKEVVPYVGPVRISCLGRNCYTGALVLGDRVLLGAIPIEDMDLVIEPTRQRVTVNPKARTCRRRS